jgi:DNA-directed RNA polymerase specialized sigma24 family protein
MFLAATSVCRMTADELQEAEAAYRAAFARAEELRQKRNRLVREAIAEGWTHARIAEATGLTRGRVNQLAHQLMRQATPSETVVIRDA